MSSGRDGLGGLGRAALVAGLSCVACGHDGAQEPAWRRVRAADAPSRRQDHGAVWTGAEMIVLGGTRDGRTLRSGARYDPATDSWRATARLGAPDVSYDGPARAVWTGREAFVFGNRLEAGHVWTTAALYDPAGDVWRPASEDGLPDLRGPSAIAWTGDEVLLWGVVDYFGGQGPREEGAAYDPTADRWRSLSTHGSPASGYGQTGAWTGRELIVGGGFTNPCCGVSSGEMQPAGHLDPIPGEGAWGAYNPATDTWRPLPRLPGPVKRSGVLLAWDGERLLAVGGWTESTGCRAPRRHAGGPRYRMTGGSVMKARDGRAPP